MENQKRTKTINKDLREMSLASYSLLIYAFFFLCVFWFSRGFCHFWSKTKKIRGKCLSLYSLLICNFCFIVVFSNFLLLVVKNQKHLEKTKKKAYPSLFSPMRLLFIIFVVVCFLCSRYFPYKISISVGFIKTNHRGNIHFI